MSGDDTRGGKGSDKASGGTSGDELELASADEDDHPKDGDGEKEPRTVLEGADGATTVPPTLVVRRGAGVGSRLAGMLAAALGLIGCLLSFVLLAICIRFGFSASSVAETTAEPLAAAVDRLETRIDQTDDLIDRDGVSGSDFRELRARLDGLADSATSASQAFSAIDDHVLYRWLPIDKSELSSSLNDFKQGADESNGVALAVDSLSPAQAARIGDRINDMQTSVSGTGDLIESTVDSLKNWIRLSALGGFVLSLWSLWAQISLMKRGWRGIRGQR
ncbi:MAG: hypothetical protein OES24_22480 [Acidimicrobiia bacterium]|nr:hypothetical protein [Acidimicrobiia bacterium]